MDEIPIPIRDDWAVFIQGIPWDMTEAEAQKIAAIITALAEDSPTAALDAALTPTPPTPQEQQQEL